LAASVVKDLAKKKIVGRIFLRLAAVVPQVEQELLEVMVPLEVTAAAAGVLLPLVCQVQVAMEHFQVVVVAVEAQARIATLPVPVVMAPLVMFASGAGKWSTQSLTPTTTASTAFCGTVNLLGNRLKVVQQSQTPTTSTRATQNRSPNLKPRLIHLLI
jgi:hypothetical protein